MARINEWLLVFLLNAAWQVTVVGLTAFAVDRLLRTAAARYRHLVWVAALMAACALPMVTAMRTQPASLSRAPNAASAVPAPVVPDASPLPGEPVDGAPPQRWQVPTLAFRPAVAVLLGVAYGLLLLSRLVMLAGAWRRTQAILREAREVELPVAIAAALARCRTALGAGNVRVLASSVPAPLTLGALRPAVILPERLLLERDSDVVTSAVGHELAHIVRRDYLFNLAYELLSLPLWFHPALARVLRGIRQTREVRCDEIVTERLQDARVYAQSLVELAGAALPFGRAAATITVGIADADILEERVKTLLNRPRLKQQTLLLAAAALLFAVPCLAAARMALRVNIQPMVAAQNTTPQVQPKQDFIQQHRVGDTVRGKIVKRTETRAVVELAPDVFTLVRVPSQSAAPYDIGSEHDFQISRMVPEENVVNLSDPTATFISPGNVEGGVVGGVPSGVVGGVKSGVVGGVPGPERIYVNTIDGEKALTASPRVGYVLTQEPGSDSGLLRKKLELAQRNAADSKRLGEGGDAFFLSDEPATPEAKQRLEALRKKLAAVETQQLLQTAREAKITMEQAISIAQTQQSGTVFESRLARERGVATYIVGIVSGDENNLTRTRFLINAIDGKVMGTFRQQPNE